MHYVLDLETDSLTNVKNIWLGVVKCIETGEYQYFRNITKDDNERKRFTDFSDDVVRNRHTLIGHNILGFDCPVLVSTLKLHPESLPALCLDTLILSKLIDYSRDGHSIEDYGEEFGLEKGKFTDFSKLSPEMETYCKRDVDICEKIYLKYKRYLSNPVHRVSVRTEHDFQHKVISALERNGFAFNTEKANRLLDKVTAELAVLDKDILEAFPPKLKLIREITPKETKYGTLNRTDFRWCSDADLSMFNGGPFCRGSWVDFNPASHKQLIDVLHTAGWKPVDKTKSHIDAERGYHTLRRQRGSVQEAADYSKRLEELKVTGWKINETNLETLPASAPKPARLLAKRILFESRRRTLTEWLDLVCEDSRIRGRFYGIGAWTHRMSHQQPNTANIPNEYDTTGKKKLLGKELRSLWCAPKNKLLVGCDAEGIQLRIFAHYINDPEFTDALVRGRKDDKTDPHSLNQRILGSACKSRAAAKRFIYALLLGAGLGKLSEILGCSNPETEEALNRLLGRYSGWTYLREAVFPKDAKRGWFEGLDGRKVRIPGDTEGSRRHLAMSGYLQNGEAVCMKLATLKWVDKLPEYDSMLVNFVHDEWQVECPNNVGKAREIGQMMADSLVEVGNDLKLKCPLAGSFYNDDLKDDTIGTNWSVTH